MVAEGNRDLGQWNGKLAASFSKLDIGRMQRTISTARGTENSGSMLNRAVDEMEQTWQPINQGVRTIMNWFATVGVKVATASGAVIKYLTRFEDVVKYLKELVEAEEEKKKAVDPLNDVLSALARGAGGRLPPGRLPDPIRPKSPLPPLR